MKSPISHAPLIRRRVMTEPDAGPSNEEPDVVTTIAEVHPAQIVAEIRAYDGRQPGPREAEDGEDAPRDSGADGDESPSSPSPTLAPLADDERSSGGSLGDDEDDDLPSPPQRRVTRSSSMSTSAARSCRVRFSARC